MPSRPVTSLLWLLLAQSPLPEIEKVKHQTEQLPGTLITLASLLHKELVTNQLGSLYL